MFKTKRNRLITKHDIDGVGDDVLNSGWRDIGKAMHSSFPDAFIFARRLGHMVTVMVNPYVNSLFDLENMQGHQIPAGFRPTSGLPTDGLFGSFGALNGDDGGYWPASGAEGVLALSDSGVIVGKGTGYVQMSRFDYVTTDPWPETLPGTAV